MKEWEYCGGKRIFLTWTEADHYARLSNRSKKSDGHLRSYRCKRCRHWHNGTPSGEHDKRKKKPLKWIQA